MAVSNFIEVYSVFDKEFCDYAIEVFEHANSHGLCLNRQQTEKVSKVYKDDLAVHFPVFDFPLQHLSAEFVQKFDIPFMNEAVQPYYDKYSQLREIGGLRYYEAKMQKTEPGQGYHVWHCEADSRDNQTRVLVWTVYLNDNFEAGETEFLYQQYRYKPKMGDVVIFPAAFTHTHRGNPPIGGTKYIITGWLEF
jgi:hypothetical protein